MVIFGHRVNFWALQFLIFSALWIRPNVPALIKSGSISNISKHSSKPNKHAVGLWTGVIYVGCGVTGVLAYTRWYVKRQILVFLLTSVVALAASIVSIAITSYGVHNRNARLERRRAEHLVTPYLTNFNEMTENLDEGAGTVTINLFVATILELFLSILSIRVAFKGYRQRYKSRD